MILSEIDFRMSLGNITFTEDDISWNKYGEIHRESKPAIVYSFGAEEWYINGRLHRADGPAVIYADGEQHWYLNGQRHREDGPAVIWASGNQEWRVNGKFMTKTEFKRKYKLRSS